MKARKRFCCVSVGLLGDTHTLFNRLNFLLVYFLMASMLYQTLCFKCMSINWYLYRQVFGKCACVVQALNARGVTLLTLQLCFCTYQVTEFPSFIPETSVLASMLVKCRWFPGAGDRLMHECTASWVLMGAIF